MKKIFGLLLLIAFINACQAPKKEVEIQPDALHNAMKKLTDVIVHDIFSPPVASRIYAYPSIAAYETLAQKDSSYIPLAGQLNGLEPIPVPEEEVNLDIAAVQSFLIIGKTLIFSEDKMDAYIKEWHEEVKASGVSSRVFDNSLAYADIVTQHILDWADKDNYKETRTFEKFNVNTNDKTRWQPTPPAYIEAIEPHWNKIRPFVLDSATQFVPPIPTPFDMNENSPFYLEVKEVYDVGNQLTEEEREIASFWDCNPYVMNVKGHVMFATKKITPGGHWMEIARIACLKEDTDLLETSRVFALTSIALADGFISCWDEKYRSNLIRPETLINQYIDEEWQPLLQTPPFPEYTSGHSVISGAAGIMLTSIFGEPFHFLDSTENKYGLPTREFNSFNEASDEAAISRLYGGIHYMPAIENGITQGRALGRHVVGQLKTRK